MHLWAGYKCVATSLRAYQRALCRSGVEEFVPGAMTPIGWVIGDMGSQGGSRPSNGGVGKLHKKDFGPRACPPVTSSRTGFRWEA